MLPETSFSDIPLYAAFLAGLLSFLSPCVLPLVPPYLAYLGGVEAAELVDEKAQHKKLFRTFFSACAFVAGFSFVFVALGATASALGEVFREHLALFNTLAGVFIIIMGLHFLGIWQIALLYRQARFDAPVKSGPVAGFFMGLAFAFGWTPCIGPVLAAILSVAGTEATVARGMMLLAIYSAGLGIPFLLASLLIKRFMKWFHLIKKKLVLIEKTMGVLLVITGVAFLFGWISDLSFFLLDTFPIFQKLG